MFFPTTHKVFGGDGVVLKFNIKRPKVGFRFECGEINLLEVSLYVHTGDDYEQLIYINSYLLWLDSCHDILFRW
jgi:hypothetical protein